MTGTKSEGKSGIAVNGFADLQRGTVGNPTDGPFAPDQNPDEVVTPAEHAAAKGEEIQEQHLVEGETKKQAEKAAK